MRPNIAFCMPQAGEDHHVRRRALLQFLWDAENWCFPPSLRMLRKVIRIVGSGVASTSTLGYALRPPQLGCACRRGERPFGPSRIRPCGLTAASYPASRFARLASTFLPGRSAGLRSGLFWPEAKTIPPLHPSPASGRAVCLLGSGKPTVKTHTHERGSISSGWPPNQPASRIAKLFGEGGACGGGEPVREGARVSGVARGKLLRPASRRLRRP